MVAQKGQRTAGSHPVCQSEDLVPAHRILRRIRKVIRLEAVEEATRDCYSQTTGRPSVDPTVAFRMILLGYLFNLSENRLCEELPMHAGYLWFCDMDFNASVPDRTTLVKLRKHTWGEKVFRQVMNSVLEDCIKAGLVQGKSLVVDGTAVDARAAITSLEPVAPVTDLETYLNTQFVDKTRDDHAKEPRPDRPASLADGDFHGERFSNATHRSRTDRDARLFRKGNEGARLSFLVHDLVDYKSSVILEREPRTPTEGLSVLPPSNSSTTPSRIIPPFGVSSCWRMPTIGLGLSSQASKDADSGRSFRPGVWIPRAMCSAPAPAS